MRTSIWAEIVIGRRIEMKSRSKIRIKTNTGTKTRIRIRIKSKIIKRALDRIARDGNQYIALSGNRHKDLPGEDIGEGAGNVAHTLPTSPSDDPALALIAGVWDRLADECKRILISVVRANLSATDG
jgi:hypothetical protein